MINILIQNHTQWSTCSNTVADSYLNDEDNKRKYDGEEEKAEES